MEKLSSDILEEDFIKMFRPVHTLLNWLGFQRVKIKHRYVTAPSVYYQFYSCTIWLLNIFAIADVVFYCETNLQALTSVIFLKFGFLANVLINAVSAWRNNFHSGNLNSQLYVKLQKIDRVFKIKGAENVNRKMFLYSVTLTAISTVVWLTCTVVLNDIAMKTLCPSVLFVQIMGIGSYMEIMLVSIMLRFLALRLDHLNAILQRETIHFKNKLKAAKMSLFAAEYDQVKSKDHNELAIGVHFTLDALVDIIKLFQFPILAFTCQVMMFDFTFLQNVVTAIKEKTANTNYIALSAAILLMLFAIMCVVSYLSNALTSKMQQTRKLCFNMLSLTSFNGDKMHMRAQQILMLLEIKSTFTIYDVYTLDNRLPLHIFAISATYTIVLLQFANL